MGPEGVLLKLCYRWFRLGVLQGLDNTPLKYDDRLGGMYLDPLFYKLHKKQHKPKTEIPDDPLRRVAAGWKAAIVNLAHPLLQRHAKQSDNE